MHKRMESLSSVADFGSYIVGVIWTWICQGGHKGDKVSGTVRDHTSWKASASFVSWALC